MLFFALVSFTVPSQNIAVFFFFLCSEGSFANVAFRSGAKCFAVTAGSSEMSQVGATFIQLRLVLNKGTRTENVYMGTVDGTSFCSLRHRVDAATIL